VIAWNVDAEDAEGKPREFYLHACKDAQLEVVADGVKGKIGGRQNMRRIKIDCHQPLRY
jgi:hypothetical protein